MLYLIIIFQTMINDKYIFKRNTGTSYRCITSKHLVCNILVYTFYKFITIFGKNMYVFYYRFTTTYYTLCYDKNMKINNHFLGVDKNK